MSPASNCAHVDALGDGWNRIAFQMKVGESCTLMAQYI
jgi:hypothetical protein